MPTRQTDTVLSAKVVREIPLWGVLCVVGAIGVFTVSQYVAVGKLTDSVHGLQTSNASLVAKVDTVVKDLADRKAEVGLLTFRIDQLERRLDAAQGSKK